MALIAQRRNLKIIIAVVVFLSLAAATLLFITRGTTPSTDQPVETETKERNEDEQQKQLEEDTNASLGEAENPAPAPLDNPVNVERPNLEVSITSLFQQGSNLQYTIQIANKPASGECILRLEKQGADRIEKNVALTDSSCSNESIALPRNPGGVWIATVMIVSNNVVATDTKTIFIR